MNLSTVATIWLKEIRDSTRDRRTLSAMLLMPLLIMPLLLIGITKFTQYQQQQTAAKTVTIAVPTDQKNSPIIQAIKNQNKVELTDSYQDLESAVAREQEDSSVSLPDNATELIDQQKVVEVTLIQKSVKDISAQAQQRVTAGLAEYNSTLISQRLDQQHIPSTVLVATTLSPVDVATSQEKSGFGLAFIVPLFIVMWAITGGMYTAIDASAGEKERKTLEALLLTPASRLDIVIGKFLAVASVSLVAVLTSLFSLYISFRYIVESFASQTGVAGSAFAQLNISDSLTPQAIGLMLLISVLLAMLFAAILLTVGIFAKSFREAQSYISPIYILAIVPVAAINAAPNFVIPTWLYLVPPINAVQVFKELLKGSYDPIHISLTIISLVIASAIALVIAARIFQQEKVLFKQ